MGRRAPGTRSSSGASPIPTATASATSPGATSKTATTTTTWASAASGSCRSPSRPATTATTSRTTPQVEPDYGDEAALKAFVAAAHERGILVIVDFVINHTSSDHPWFKDALEGGPHRDWYVWSETDPGWPPAAGPSPWHRDRGRRLLLRRVLRADAGPQPAQPGRSPRRSTGSPGVWLDDFGVDGFRIDAAKHLIEDDGAHQVEHARDARLARRLLRRRSTPRTRTRCVLGEVWDISKTAGGYVPDSLDLTFDFGLASAIGLGASRAAAPPPIAHGAGGDAHLLAGESRGVVPHQPRPEPGDEQRSSATCPSAPPGRVHAPDRRRASPFIYYGEEIGLRAASRTSRSARRCRWSADGPAAGFTTGEPWEPLAEDWPTVNVAAAGRRPGEPARHLSRARSRSGRASGARARAATLLVGRRRGARSSAGCASPPARPCSSSSTSAPPVVSDYALTLDGGPLCGVSSAATRGRRRRTPAAPASRRRSINATGGFDAYQPIADAPAPQRLRHPAEHAP